MITYDVHSLTGYVLPPRIHWHVPHSWGIWCGWATGSPREMVEEGGIKDVKHFHYGQKIYYIQAVNYFDSISIKTLSKSFNETFSKPVSLILKHWVIILYTYQKIG